MACIATACDKQPANTNNNTDYPEINAFVSSHFPQASIRTARPDGDEID